MIVRDKNIVVVSLTSDIDPIELGTARVFTSNLRDNTRRLADLALQIDQYIYLQNSSVDMIYVTNRINQIEFDQFDPNFVYFVSNNLHQSSFYCAPNIFSLLGSLYKIDLTQYQFTNVNMDSTAMLTERIFWLLNRLGVEYKIAQG